MNTSNFIEEYEIDTSICDKFIEYHKNNTEYKHPGYTYKELDTDVKESIDVEFFNNSNDENITKFFKKLGDCVTNYMTEYKIMSDLQTDTINLIQYYKKGGGYKKYHYERSSLKDSRRQLVYTLYCNTLKNGGTHFLYQDKTVQAKKGKLVIWPSDFTHTHKSVVSNTQEKYIVTGWFNFI